MWRPNNISLAWLVKIFSLLMISPEIGLANLIKTVGKQTKESAQCNAGQLLAQVKFQDAVMLDSRASTSVAYQGKSLVIPNPP